MTTKIPYRLELREEAAAGNVRQKLKQAKAAANVDEKFLPTLELLQQVQPPDVPLSKVDISPAAWWIPKSEISAFALEVLGVHADFHREDIGGYWEVKALMGEDSVANCQTYGMTWFDMTMKGEPDDKELTGLQLLEMILNFKIPNIKVRKQPYAKKVKDASLTATAADKQNQLRDRFAEWCKEDADRAMRLQFLYNFQCNNIRLRDYDGCHLSLSNMTTKWAERVLNRSYQRNAIYRGVTGQPLEGEMGNLGIFHAVGLGKTIDLCAIACERVLNGTATRAMIVVQKSTLSDVAETLREAYPQVRAIVATPEDLKGKNRQMFLARCAYNNAQVIVLTHEAKSRIPLKIETEKAYIRELLKRIEEQDALMEEAHIDGNSKSRKSLRRKLERCYQTLNELDIQEVEIHVNMTQDNLEDWRRRTPVADPENNITLEEAIRQKRKTVKNLERKLNRLTNRLKGLRERRDFGLFWEDLGIDLLLIDEADKLKNAGIYTKMQSVAGLPTTRSDRAYDFRLKKWWMEQTYGTGRVCLATGTFISNSLCELWIVLMDLIPNVMESRGWHLFDAWAAACGKITVGAAIKNTGTIEREMKFAEFVNLPEVLQVLYAVADIKSGTDDDVEIIRPKVKTVNVVAPMSDVQRAFMDELVERSQEIKNKKPRSFFRYDKEGNPVYEEVFKEGRYVQEHAVLVDNNLTLTTEGRKSVVDHRLIDPNVRDFYKSKINMCVRRAYKWWKRTRHSRKTQLIFLDMGVTPTYSTDGVMFWLYGDIRDKLYALADRDGLGEEMRAEFAIAHDYTSEEKREKLHQALREGSVRIALGTTELFGVGVNVQNKLLILHNLDPRWRPREMVQRGGRIERPGNENSRVIIYNYLTQGRDGNVGFDSFMYDKIRWKTAAFSKLFTKNFTDRTIAEDASEDPTFSTAEIVALCTGDERIMKYVELEAEIAIKKTLLSGWLTELEQMNSPYWEHRWLSMRGLERIIKDTQRRLERMQPDAEIVLANRDTCTGEAFEIEVEDVVYNYPVSASKHLHNIAHNLVLEMKEAGHSRRSRSVGYYGGFELILEVSNSESDYFYLPGSERHKIIFLRDDYSSMQRLQDEYLRIVKKMNDEEKNLENHHKRLEQIKAEYTKRMGQVEELQATLSVMESNKLALEQELGLNKTVESELLEVDFGDDDQE
ncbi:MAG TPA: helicase-related protein [Allocoleopsis sp.]